MRVCILAQASPASWVAHYVAAFRRACDTIVIGPNPDAALLEEWDRAGAADLVVPNDIDQDLEADFELADVLPAGWEPDLAVGIAGLGGDPLWPGVAKLTCPTAFITVDTWQCLLEFREALRYDFVFPAQREFVDHLRDTGSRHVCWLPLACAPEAHYPAGITPTHDIAFAGMSSVGAHQPRRELLAKLAQRFSVLAGAHIFGDALCRFLARGRLAFNRSAGQELNMRIFEAMAMGRPLLTNSASAYNGLFDLFEDGTHLIAWENEADLMAKAEACLADTAARRRMAETARECVLADHTYDRRVADLIDRVSREETASDPRRKTTAYRTDSAADYLPTVPGETIDFGCAMKSSKVALRRRGVTRFTGLDCGIEAVRPSSYDTVLTPGAAENEIADTVVVASAAAAGMPFGEMLRRTHALLRRGGILVLRLSGADRRMAGLKPEEASCGLFFEPFDFHCRLPCPALEDGGFYIQLRKRRRRLALIIEEVYTRLAIPDIDVPDLIGRIPESW
jgi:hypothetical protein